MSVRNKPISRREDIVVQELDGEVLVYDLRSNKAFSLNETSALIWNACDGNRDVNDLSAFVASKLNSPQNDDLVWLALDQLKKEKLIENVPNSEGYFGGMSRRDVIKKVGLGTMIALPIVASLVAPSAAHAASCTAGTSGCQCVQVGCPCTRGQNQCQGTATCNSSNICA